MPTTTSDERGSTEGLVLVVGVALIARLAYWAMAARHYTPVSDAGQYDELARNIAAGRRFSLIYPQLALHPTAFRPPGYPAVLGFAYWIFGPSVGLGMALNLLIGLGVVALTYRFVAAIGGSVAALAAAGVLAIYPPLLVNDLCLLTEPLSLLLMVAALRALVGRRPMLAGLFSGLLVLTRPSAQGLALIVGLWCLWQFGWRRSLRVAAVAALVIVPWTVRNWVQLGSPVLVTSNGFNFAAMHSEQARVSGHFVDPTVDVRFDDIRLSQFDEVEWDRSLRKRTLRDVRHHPGHVLQVVGRNSLAYFEIVPGNNTTPERLDGRSATVRAIGLPMFYVVTAGGLVGLALHRRKPGVLLAAGMGAYFALTSLVFVAPPRLRAPFDLVCCIGFGLLVAQLGERRRPRHDEASPGEAQVPGLQVRCTADSVALVRTSSVATFIRRGWRLCSAANSVRFSPGQAKA